MTNHSPLVSVIVAARNAAPTIGAALRSALAQSETSIEVIVVDDGSTDATAEVVRAINDPRLRCLTVDHQGVSAGRNRGVAEASGHYMAFLDADDIWLPEKLALQVTALRENPDAQVAYGLLDRFIDPQSPEPHTRDAIGGDILDVLLERNVIGCGSNLLVDAELLRVVGGFDERLEVAEDWELAVRLAARSTFAAVDEVVALYRQPHTATSADLPRSDRGYRLAQRIAAEHVRYTWHRRMRGRAYHYRYLLAVTQRRPGTAIDQLRGLRYLAYSSLLARFFKGLPATLGLRPRQLRRISRKLTQQVWQLWRRRTEYLRRGFVQASQPLALTSRLESVLEDAHLFDRALEQLRRQGLEHRVPYLHTAAIRQVAADPNIVALVDDFLGSDWVMWGANIRRDIPNQAEFWHVDAESILWSSLTVVVGLAGCGEANSTCYVGGSHRLRAYPPEGLPAADRAAVRKECLRRGLAEPRIERFSSFGNGCFYVFDAGGWHCGEPGPSQGRVMLFLHFQLASEPRIPYMDDYHLGTWQDVAAPFLARSELLSRPEDQPINSRLATPDDRLKPRPSFRSRVRPLIRRWRSG